MNSRSRREAETVPTRAIWVFSRESTGRPVFGRYNRHTESLKNYGSPDGGPKVRILRPPGEKSTANLTTFCSRFPQCGLCGRIQRAEKPRPILLGQRRRPPGILSKLPQTPGYITTGKRASAFASVHCFPVGETTRAPFLRQRDASGMCEVTHTSVGPMRSAIQSSAASALSPTTRVTVDRPGRRRQTGSAARTGFDDRQAQVYRAPSQAGPGNDINAGSPGFQKARFTGICRRSPLEGRQIHCTGAWMGSDKDGRPFSTGRSSSGLRNPGVACYE